MIPSYNKNYFLIDIMLYHRLNTYKYIDDHTTIYGNDDHDI